MYYSLKKVTHIGRHDGEPAPQIILRGVGIQRNHAQIRLRDDCTFELFVSGKESWDQTLVNGNRLSKI